MTETTDGQRALPPIDPARYREVLGHYPTGVAVVTGSTPDGEPVGMVVGTFTAVSLDPPLVAFLPTRVSGTFAMMRDSPAYCINVLAHDQQDLCRLMAVPRAGKFDDVAWRPSPLGVPMLDDAVAHIHCRPHEVVPAGDHDIVLCAVEDMAVTRPVTPLLFFQGGYGGFSPQGMAARGDAELIAAIRLAEVGRPQIERLARTFACEAAVLVAVNDHELTTAVSAYGGTAEMREPLGQRIPLMPPVGEVYVAWSAPEVIDAWLARSTTSSTETVATQRRRLEAVRERGYALARLSPDTGDRYAQLWAALHEYGSGVLTPARDRAVRAVIADCSDIYETFDVQVDERYALGSVVVPVHSPGGGVALVLRMTQLPPGVDGRQVLEWVAAMQFAAGSVSRSLDGQGSHDLRDYLDSFPGDFMM